MSDAMATTLVGLFGLLGTLATVLVGRGLGAGGKHEPTESTAHVEATHEAVDKWISLTEALLARITALETSQGGLQDRVAELERVVARLRTWRENAMVYIHRLRDLLGSGAPPIPPELDYRDEDQP